MTTYLVETKDNTAKIENIPHEELDVEGMCDIPLGNGLIMFIELWVFLSNNEHNN